MTKKNIRTLSYIGISIVLVVCVFMAGTYMGYSHRPEVEKVLSVIHKEPLSVDTQADFSPFWKVWNVLNEKSIYAHKVTDQDRVWGAAQGLASSLGDPYTVFFSPQENQMFNDEIKGSFGGIGAEVDIKDNILTIIAPIKDSPADKAGLKTNDKILKINDTETTDMTVDKAISLIRGEKGTTVTLIVLRGSEQATRTFKIVRDTINSPIIDSELRSDGVFVIHFYTFSENSAQLFGEELKKFIASGSHKLILDMRGNPGGYLQSAVQIGSWFIDQGKTIVSEDFGPNKKPDVYRSNGPRLFDDKLQFIVLVNGGSASAAEILSGALKEHGIATLVGEKTFGKGSVQELVPITDTTSLKVTVAKWLTPNGVSISEHGLDPDVVVPLTLKDYQAGKDPQMDKAVQILEAKQ
jgi:carboxyl-terminal processing protease